MLKEQNGFLSSHILLEMCLWNNKDTQIIMWDYIGTMFCCWMKGVWKKIVFRKNKSKYEKDRKRDAKAFYINTKQKSIDLVLNGIFKTMLYALIVWIADIIQSQIATGVSKVDPNMFNSLIICGIGMAVVILGLYCSNIASIYSVSYKNAPKELANRFYEDKLTGRSILSLIDYIIFGLVLLCHAFFTEVLNWMSVFIYSFWTAYVVCSFAASRNRVYQLADVYSLASISQYEISKITTKYLTHKKFANDAKFQLDFQENAKTQLMNLRTIQRYASSKADNSSVDHSSVNKFMSDNLDIIRGYWLNKKNINTESDWYKAREGYSKWHTVSGVEAIFFLGTGFSMKKTERVDWCWLEDEIFEINNTCLEELFEQKSYDSILQYMDAVRKLLETSLQCNETECYLGHLKQIDHIFERIIDDAIGDKIDTDLSEVLEKMALLYLDFLGIAIEILSSYEVDSIMTDVRKTIDSSKDLMREWTVLARKNNSFFQCLKNEYEVEGRRITPDRVVNNEIACEEYEKINTLIKSIRDASWNMFCLGEKCEKSHMLFEECLILVKYFEYERRMRQFIDLVKEQQNKILVYKCDSDTRWSDFPLKELDKENKSIKEKIPNLLSECVSEFAKKNWKKLNQYPDFLGECFYQMCDNTVSDLIANDIKQFELDYCNLTSVMSIYRNYIYENTLDNQTDRSFFQMNATAVPMIEWAFVGGLSIIWGAFENNRNWSETVRKCTNGFWDNGIDVDFAEKLIGYICHQDFVFSSKDMMEMNWKARVESAIKERHMYETEDDCYGKRLNTQIQWLNEFCSRFEDVGFFNDPSEVFLVVCINPNLEIDKQFCTDKSWGALLNDYIQFEG